MSEGLRIGEVAARSGVPSKTIRFYEEIGVLPAPARADNGYRVYGERAVDELRFVHRARGLGFSLDDVRELLSLWRDRDRASADVKAVTRRHVEAIEAKLAELEAMRRVLLDLAARCHGDDRPDCPILAELADGA